MGRSDGVVTLAVWLRHRACRSFLFLPESRIPDLAFLDNISNLSFFLFSCRFLDSGFGHIDIAPETL